MAHEHSFLTPAYFDLAREVHDYPWLGRCGAGETFESPLAVRWAGSAAHAQAACTGPFWDRVLLEAQNEMTSFLHRVARDRYQRWNDIVREAKSGVVQPLLDGVLGDRIEECGLAIGARHCIQMNLVMALAYGAYSDLEGLPRFHEQLLAVYRAGHFPCGWYCGWPPQGAVLVW